MLVVVLNTCFYVFIGFLILSMLKYIFSFIIFCFVSKSFNFKKFYFDYVPKFQPFHLYKWLIVDICRSLKSNKRFKEFGLTIFCGRQGGGKTTAMTEYLERMRIKYPKCLIITNFGYIHQNKRLEGWSDLMTIRNSTDGVIFAIDEIHSEFSSNAWKDFPESLLREITQQRKQCVKIVATSQIFTRVVKQIREQCYEVAECRTICGRLTKVKVYDADDYNSIIDNPNPRVKFKLPKKNKYSFIQTDNFRELFDTYLKIEQIRKVGFAPKTTNN